MSYSDNFRYPRTKNEMTQYYASIETEVNVIVKMRGRRKPKALPNAWDDIYRSNMCVRSWKAYRKKQWK